MSVDVTHDPDGSRYTLWLDGARAGFADYLIQGDRIVFTHTEVDPAKRRGGLGGELVRAALDDVRGGSRTVVAACPFVAEWIDEHPDYRELLERG